MIRKTTNILSVDMEDWYQAFAFISSDKWNSYESRIKYSTDKVLKLLGETDSKATFFVLGLLGEKHPALIKSICDEGHEIASHGYDHSFVYKQKKEDFRNHLRKSMDILENITGEKIRGFRAPWWSVTKESLWALDILLEEGIKYDSSIFPMKTGYYGINMPYRGITKITTPSGASITEVPPSVNSFFGIKIPATGGFYLRALPLFITKWGIDRLNKKGLPAHIYFHPWELDREQPVLNSSFSEKFIHYYGLDQCSDKLRNVLTKKEFYTIKTTINYFDGF